MRPLTPPPPPPPTGPAGPGAVVPPPGDVPPGAVPPGDVPPVPGSGAPQPRVRDRTGPKITGLSCASCGGPLEVEPGLRVLVCGYCDTPLLVTGPPGVRRLSVEPRVRSDEARETVRRWLGSGWTKDPRLEREGEVGEAFLCFLPFYRLQADAVGYALGTERRTRTVGSGKNRRTETYEVDVERPVQEHLDETFPAVNAAEWGIERIDLTGDRLRSFDADGLERLGLVFPPTGSEAEVRSAALEEFKRRVDPRPGLHRVRFFWMSTVRERLTVVYYPLWVVRYRFRGRAYQVLVDAEDGRVAWGKAPGSDVYRAAALVATQAAAAFLATTALQYRVFHHEVLLVVLALACLFLLAAGWQRFRWGGEVIQGTGVRSKPLPGMGWARSLARSRGVRLPRSLGGERR